MLHYIMYVTALKQLFFIKTTKSYLAIEPYPVLGRFGSACIILVNSVITSFLWNRILHLKHFCIPIYIFCYVNLCGTLQTMSVLLVCLDLGEKFFKLLALLFYSIHVLVFYVCALITLSLVKIYMHWVFIST